MEHAEPSDTDKAKARTLHRPFHGGTEGCEDWDPLKFTMVSVQNDKKRNGRGQPIGYDFMPTKHGNARHYGPDKEECTWHDFWVTKNRPGEIYYQRLPEYVKKAEPDHGHRRRRLAQHAGPPRATLRGRRAQGIAFRRRHAAHVVRLRHEAPQSFRSQPAVSVASRNYFGHGGS